LLNARRVVALSGHEPLILLAIEDIRNGSSVIRGFHKAKSV
jgi:hypothetical protein